MKETTKWILSAIGTVIIERLLNLIPIENLFMAEKWNWMIAPRFSVLNILLLVVSFVLVLGVIKTFNLGRKKTRLEKHLEKLSPIVDYENDIKVTWNLSMGSMYNIDPHPYNIRVFCLKHNPPLLLYKGYCPDGTCQNAHKYFDEFAIRNQVESKILNERDKFMKK